MKQSKKIIKEVPKVLLIIPAYNEEDSIVKTINNIKKYNYDYIIVNDGSTDKTLEICKNNGYNYLSLTNNLGIGGAVQTGYKYAYVNNYDIAVQFDADGQHDIDYIEKLIEPIIKGKAHMTIGSRFVDQSKSNFKSTKSRRIGINLISRLIKRLSGVKIYDTTSGYRAVNRDIINLFSTRYPLEYPEPITNFELIHSGFVIKEIPVNMYERQGGKSSINSWKNAYYMINVYLSIIIEFLRGGKQ